MGSVRNRSAGRPGAKFSQVSCAFRGAPSRCFSRAPFVRPAGGAVGLAGDPLCPHSTLRRGRSGCGMPKGCPRGWLTPSRSAGVSKVQLRYPATIFRSGYWWWRGVQCQTCFSRQFPPGLRGRLPRPVLTAGAHRAGRIEARCSPLQIAAVVQASQLRRELIKYQSAPPQARHRDRSPWSGLKFGEWQLLAEEG